MEGPSLLAVLLDRIAVVDEGGLFIADAAETDPGGILLGFVGVDHYELAEMLHGLAGQGLRTHRAVEVDLVAGLDRAAESLVADQLVVAELRAHEHQPTQLAEDREQNHALVGVQDLVAMGALVLVGHGRRSFLKSDPDAQDTDSMIRAFPWPPPIHMVTSP